MPLDLDISQRHSDWLRSRTWDLWHKGRLVETLDELLTVIGGEQLAHFLALPAAEAMPESLRKEAEAAVATKHLQGKHDQSEHGRGRTGAETDSPKPKPGYPEDAAARLATATYSDIKSQMTRNLDAIRRKIPGKEAKVSGELDEDKIAAIANNARASVGSYANYLAGDTTHLLHTFVNTLENTLSAASKAGQLKGVDAKDLGKLAKDTVDKLVHQEIESNRQQFTDHGIRHVVGNVAMQQRVLDVLAGQGFETSPRERLLGMIAMVNHDVGYTASLVRQGGMPGIQASGEHKEYGAKIAEEQRDLWDRGKIFSEKEHDRIVELIRTHDDANLDVKNPLAFATRTADNLALFQNEKLPSMFKYVPGGGKLLAELGIAAKAGDDQAWEASRRRLIAATDKSKLSAPLKRDLLAGVGEINKFTPKFALGSLAGEISGVRPDKDSLLQVTVKHNRWDQFLQQHFDMGQKATKKFLEAYGVTDFNGTEYRLGEHNGKPVLVIRVEGLPKAKKAKPAPAGKSHPFKVANPREDFEASFRQKVQDLLADLGSEIAELIAAGQVVSDEDIAKELTKLLEPLLTEAVERAGAGLPGEYATDIPFETPSAAVWAKQYTYDLVRGLTDHTRNVLQNAVSEFFDTAGMTRSDLVKLLEPAFGSGRADIIAITEVTRAASAAQNLYRGQLLENGINMSRMWHTLADEMVCEICGPLNSQTEDTWASRFPDGPPAHPRCRCAVGLTLAET